MSTSELRREVSTLLQKRQRESRHERVRMREYEEYYGKDICSLTNSFSECGLFHKKEWERERAFQVTAKVLVNDAEVKTPLEWGDVIAASNRGL